MKPQHERERLILQFVALLLALTIPVAQDASPPVAPAPEAPAPAAASVIDPKVDQILTDLESAGASVKNLRSQIRYKVVDTLNFDEYVKHGEIIFMDDQPNPKFHIAFDKREQGGVVNRDREWWTFDGRWLWEVNEGVGQVMQREVVAPGEKIDLFNIETAPFPIPFGQKKDQILKHFDVTLVAQKSDDPANTDHLRCVPKPGSRLADDYDLLDFYILKDLHLPNRIVATEKLASKLIVSDFPDLSAKSINPGVDKKRFEPLQEWKQFGMPIVETLEKAEEKK